MVISTIRRMKAQLPEELITSEILTRLPVKSLMRFKSVSKSWYALFKNPIFINAHCINQQNNNSRLLVNGVKRGEEQVLSILSDETLELDSYLEVTFPVDDDKGLRNYTIGLVGSSSVNGIICVLLQLSTPVLWNPATREFKFIPFSYSYRPDRLTVYQGYGFGYDSITDDYKVVRTVLTAVYFPHLGRRSLYHFAEAYSLRKDCWTKLDAAVSWYVDMDEISSNLLLNGVFHWMAVEKTVPCNKILLSFDMSSDLFSTTFLPYLDDDSKTKEEIKSLKGSIAMITFTCDLFEQLLLEERCFDIWILGKVGVKESWTKHLTIGPLSHITRPFGVGKNGEVFFLKDLGGATNVACYDPNTQICRNLRFDLCGWIPTVAVYSESLVFLHKKSDDTEN